MENIKRIPYIDFMKGLAVIFMLFQHLGVWFWDIPWSQISNLLIDFPFYMGTNALGGFSAPAFITCAGFGAYFFNKKYKSPKRLIHRGIFLILTGIILNLAAPIWFKISSWYVLHMIGFGLVISPVILKIFENKKLFLLTIILIFITTIIGQYLLHTPVKYSSTRMNNTFLPGGFFRLMFFEGHFPVFPWILFYLSGIFCAEKTLNGETNKILKLSIISLSISIILFIVSFTVKPILPQSLKNFMTITTSFYPLWPIMLFFLLFLTIFAIYILSLINKKKEFSPNNPIVLTGKLSLTIFVSHIIIFKQGLNLIDKYKIFNSVTSYILMLSVTLTYILIAVFWSKVKFKYSIEWILHEL